MMGYSIPWPVGTISHLDLPGDLLLLLLDHTVAEGNSSFLDVSLPFDSTTISLSEVQGSATEGTFVLFAGYKVRVLVVEYLNGYRIKLL